MADITISGFEEVSRRIDAAPSLLVAKAFKEALDRGIGVIAEEVEARTPTGETGLLKESVTTLVQLDVQSKGGSAACGFNSTASERTGKPQDLIALWVEFGHRLESHDGKQIGHVQAHPFMRPAFDAAADHAIEVFAETLLNQLDVIEHG